MQTQATHYLFTLKLRLNNDYCQFVKKKYQGTHYLFTLVNTESESVKLSQALKCQQNVMKFTANVQQTSLVRYFRRKDDERGSIFRF